MQNSPPKSWQTSSINQIERGQVRVERVFNALTERADSVSVLFCLTKSGRVCYTWGMKSKTKKMALCALFTALLAVSSFIRIPAPLSPITLQVQVALLGGVLLGGWGALSVLLYALLGLAGLPIFASGGGFSYVVQPTFGYILGLTCAAWVVGKIARNGVITNGKNALAFAVGLAITYLIGTAYAALILTAYLHQTIALGEFLTAYVLLTLPKDLILCAVAVPIAKRLLPHTI